VELVIGMGDRPVDLVQEAVDCVIRAGELADSTLVARRIGSLSFVTCGAPAYLARYGEPRTLEDLQHHHAVHYFSSVTGRNFDWDFVVDGVSARAHERPGGGERCRCVQRLRLAGLRADPAATFHGLALPGYGELKEILPAWKSPPCPCRCSIPRTVTCHPRCGPLPTGWPSCSASARCSMAAMGRVKAGECRYPERPSSYTVREMLAQENQLAGLG
jgi:LysR family transcriptional regulator for bpeEF and oprC